MARLPEQFYETVDMRNVLAVQKPSHAHLRNENLSDLSLSTLRYQSDQGISNEDYQKLWDSIVLGEFGLEAFCIGSHKINGWTILIRKLPDGIEYNWPINNMLALPKLDFLAYPDGKVISTTPFCYVVNTDKIEGDIFEARGFLSIGVDPLVQSSEATDLIDTFFANRV